jgi:hypothetical protein
MLTGSSPPGSGRRTNGLWSWDPAILLALSAFAYLPAVVFGYFVADDFNIGGLHDPAGRVQWEALWSALECRSTAGYFYRPIAYIFVAVEYLLWGANPTGYFLSGLLVHGLLAGVVWGVARELGWARAPALAAGSTMVLHPLHLETLWWVAGQFDLLAALFSSAALWAYVRWVRGGRAPVAAATVIGYTLAVFAKEAAITLPIALAMTAGLMGRSQRVVRPAPHLALYLVLLTVGAGFLLVRRLCLGFSIGQYPGGPSPASPLQILAGIPAFVVFMLFPAPYRGLDAVPLLVPIAAGVSACVLGALLLWRGERRATFWMGAMTGSLALPVLAIVGALLHPGEQGRFFLLPTIGFALLTGSLFGGLRRGKQRLQLAALLLAWLVLLAHYHRSRMETAQATWRILRQIEIAGATPGVSRLVIAGLPENLFGAGGFALRRAAGQPFINLPKPVTVEVAPSPPPAPEGSTRVLVWSTARRSLVPLDDGR